MSKKCVVNYPPKRHENESDYFWVECHQYEYIFRVNACKKYFGKSSKNILTYKIRCRVIIGKREEESEKTDQS